MTNLPPLAGCLDRTSLLMATISKVVWHSFSLPQHCTCFIAALQERNFFSHTDIMQNIWDNICLCIFLRYTGSKKCIMWLIKQAVAVYIMFLVDGFAMRLSMPQHVHTCFCQCFNWRSTWISTWLTNHCLLQFQLSVYVLATGGAIQNLNHRFQRANVKSANFHHFFFLFY